MVDGLRCVCYRCGYTFWGILLTLIGTEKVLWKSYETSLTEQVQFNLTNSYWMYHDHDKLETLFTLC